MSQANKVLSITEKPGKAYIDPESIEIVVQILNDLKRKISETQDFLAMMQKQQAVD